MPLIGQAAHGRMAGIIVLTAWPIRGIPFPHENGGKLSLTALFGMYLICVSLFDFVPLTQSCTKRDVRVSFPPFS